MPAKKAAKATKNSNKQSINEVEGRKSRNFPKHSLEASLPVAQKIQDENGGKPLNRLLLAEALGLSPSSSNFRDILSSSYKYGLTDGTEKAELISLSEIGQFATGSDSAAKLNALRTAALKSPVFGQFFKDFTNKKVPSQEMLPRVLNATYGVPKELTSECASLIETNGKFVHFIREIGGSPHILLGSDGVANEASGSSNLSNDGQVGLSLLDQLQSEEISAEPPEKRKPTDPPIVPTASPSPSPKPIFVAHGKNKAPLHQLEKLLTSFQIPHKVVTDEANLGRPIPQKVRDTLNMCGSAILIFTKDEQFFDKDQNEIWRPSENVVHELGATSFLYGDRIVIFKEKGISFPTNFQSIGYIEFENNDIQARTAELLRELIGFGLVKVTPT